MTRLSCRPRAALLALTALVAASGCGGVARLDDGAGGAAGASQAGAGAGAGAGGPGGATAAGGTGTGASGGVAAVGGAGGLPPEPCPPGLTGCGQACADLSVDPGNCGSCGQAYCPGALCSGGHCVLGCGAGTIECGQSCEAPDCDCQCVSAAVDPKNCGGCDLACQPGEICQDGGCK
ncbi:MAG: hypothetical protein HY744_17430 [Deltaproteobacteria bacterium]|nr:hypothetical protein [Deltaproteobacteria bacterium]